MLSKILSCLKYYKHKQAKKQYAVVSIFICNSFQTWSEQTL